MEEDIGISAVLGLIENFFKILKISNRSFYIGSEYLKVLQKNFVNLVRENKIEVLSFAETEPAKFARDTLIVSPDSAGTKLTF